MHLRKVKFFLLILLFTPFTWTTGNVQQQRSEIATATTGEDIQLARHYVRRGLRKAVRGPDVIIPPPTAPLAAFPGAEGFGADATGGRGGQVIKVTNLNDSGSGSLRACIDASGPRYCIFEVGGVISLSSSLDIGNPDITIAGQTALGDGIELRGNSSSRMLGIVANIDANVVIRNLRVRLGQAGTQLDPMLVFDATNIIFDHISSSWGTDETFATGDDSRLVTLQWSLIYEGMETHSASIIIGSRRSGDMSFHHNLMAQSVDRHPRVGANDGILDYSNNIHYNWTTTRPCTLDKKSDVTGDFDMNFVNNYWKLGPETGPQEKICEAKTTSNIFETGNFTSGITPFITGAVNVLSTRLVAPPITETSAQQAFIDVLAPGGAGANMRLTCDGDLFFDRRDSHDARIVADVQSGTDSLGTTGSIITDISEVGGFQPVSGGTPCLDTDDDGMPDAFEDRYGLNKNSASDANGDADGDGYPNLEEFLNGTNPLVSDT